MIVTDEPHRRTPKLDRRAGENPRNERGSRKIQAEAGREVGRPTLLSYNTIRGESDRRCGHHARFLNRW